MSPGRVIPVGKEPRPSRDTQGKSVGHQDSDPPDRKVPTSLRFHHMNTFVDSWMRKLRPSEHTVWFILWRDTNPNGLATCSQRYIATRAGLSEKTVYRAIRTLRKKGLLIVVKQGAIGRGASTYKVQCNPTSNQRRINLATTAIERP